MIIQQIIKLIPITYRKQGIWIICSAIFQAFLNMAGLTILIPLIILVLDSSKFENYPWFGDYRSLILISIICFIFIKNLLNIWLSKIQICYINTLYIYYSSKLYYNYYSQGLLFIKNKHSDGLTYNTNVVSYLFTHGVLSLTLSITAETLLFLFIWCGIFWFSPLIAFAIAIGLVPFAISYFYWVKKKIEAYGEKEDNAKRHIMTLVGDTFRGYSDVKLNNAYPWFKKRFDANITEITHTREWITRALHIPQGMVECYVVIGMILFIIVGGNNDESRLVFGVLSVAVLRILPSLRSIITMATQWKNNAFTIGIIKDIYTTIDEDDQQLIFFQKQIKIENVSFAYPDKNLLILRDFYLNINKGECLGIQGLSGIGKTTLFNLLLGFYKPQKGIIQIDDVPLNERTYFAWQKLIAYVPQDIFIMDTTLAENIAFGTESIDNERMMQAIEKSELLDYVSTLTEGIYTRVGQNGSRLSGGERQRVGIARALYKKAEVLFFDEATSSLDLKTEKEVINTIYKLSRETNDLTVVIILHKKSILASCERIVEITKSIYKIENHISSEEKKAD